MRLKPEKTPSQVSAAMWIEQFKIVTMRDKARGTAVQIGVSNEHLEISVGGQSFRTSLQQGIGFIEAVRELYVDAVSNPAATHPPAAKKPSAKKSAAPKKAVIARKPVAKPAEKKRRDAIESVALEPAGVAAVPAAPAEPVVLNDTALITAKWTQPTEPVVLIEAASNDAHAARSDDPTQPQVAQSQEALTTDTLILALQPSGPELGGEDPDGLSDFLSRTAEIPETTAPAGIPVSYAPQPLTRRRFEVQQSLALSPQDQPETISPSKATNPATLMPVRLRFGARQKSSRSILLPR